MGEVVRSARWLNIVIGAGVAALVWLTGAAGVYAAFVTLVGVSVAVLAVPRGRVVERYADWDHFIR